MYREEIFGIAIAVLSIVFAVLGYIWNIEVLKFPFTFLAGVFTTYVIQHRLQIEAEKRKIKREMRDKVYGPIFMGVSDMLERVDLVQYFDWTMLDDLKGVMTHYLFFTIKQDLKSKFSELLNRVEKYQKIRRATEIMLQDVIRKEIEKAYSVDIGTNESTPGIGLRIGKINVAWITLRQTLLRGIEPRDFVRTETEKWGKDLQIEVSIGGKKSSDLSDFESLCGNVLHEVEGEPLHREEKEQRSRLVDELEAFLEQVKVFINLE